MKLPREEFEEMKKRYKYEKIFTRYYEGIRLSPTMIYSVTKEKIANQIAVTAWNEGFRYAVDGCGGAGGNSIAFAAQGMRVACVDINDENLYDARHNAKIYGVEDKIEFVKSDILQYTPPDYMLEDLEHTVFFASPEWGGPKYRDFKVYDANKLNPPLESILEYTKDFFPMTIIYAPRNIDLEQVAKLGCKETRYMYLDGWCDALCLIFEAAPKKSVALEIAKKRKEAIKS